MRLIDADELQQVFNEVSTSLMRKPALTKDIEHMVRAFLMTTEMIKDAPTIEVEPVRHGRWIHHTGMNSKCSCCGRYFPVAEFEQRPFDVNFCSHCGAKMDGGAD